MKSHYRVVVIGGGIVGAGVLYHLTRKGWGDIALIERSELTAGSTWHAAGGFHPLNGDTNMAALPGYTIQLYKELEKIAGMSCGHCLNAVNRALAGVPGIEVKSVRIGQAELRTPDAATTERAKAAIAAAGYKVEG